MLSLSRFVTHKLIFFSQNIVVDVNRAYACFAYSHGDILLGLLLEDEHYNALTTLKGLFGHSYFCPHCLKGYNPLGEHACPNNKANHCGACMQKGSEDHAEAYKSYRQADLACGDQCHRFFYGHQCLDAPKLKAMSGKPVGPDRPSVCDTCRKCPECRTLLRGRQEIQRHPCGCVQCRCCKEIVDVHEHRCFLQREKTPEELREERRELRGQLMRALRGAAAGLQIVCSNNPSTAAAADDFDADEPVPPLQVFFDIESTKVEGRHVPNLVVVETAKTASRYFWNGSIR